jgi:hypothetical protein
VAPAETFRVETQLKSPSHDQLFMILRRNNLGKSIIRPLPPSTSQTIAGSQCPLQVCSPL